MTRVHAEAEKNIKNAAEGRAMSNLINPENEYELMTREALVEEEGEEGKFTLSKLMPEGAMLEVYLDYDRSFIVIYPVFIIGDRKYNLSFMLQRNVGKTNFDAEWFSIYLVSRLSEFNFYRSEYFPEILTMPLIYTQDILDFLLYVIPEFLKRGKVYFTKSFKTVMIKKSLKISFSCPSGSLFDYLECNFEYDNDLSPEDIEELLKAGEEDEELRFFQLYKGGFIDLRESKVTQTLNFLSKFGITREDLEKRKIHIPVYEIPYAADMIDDASNSGYVKLEGLDIKSIKQKIFNLKEESVTIPDQLKGELRHYQKDGFLWMKMLLGTGLGGILADDMGLGKTIQAIALILSEFQDKGSIKCLVVVPTTLIDNWMIELGRFAPCLRCEALTGDVGYRSKVWERFDSFDVLITSYNLVVNDIDLYKEKTFDLLVLDEAQRIKNHLTKTFKSVKKINTRSKIALTGTPIENNLSELWSVFNWLIPPMFKSFEKFKRDYINNNDEKLEELRNRIKPFIMRRLKSEVLKDLPEKTDTTVKVDLTDEQKKLYLAYRKKALETIEKEGVFNALYILTRLRQICCHPGMFVKDFKEVSPKLEVLFEIVEELEGEGRQVLVFSQFTSMLDIIETEIKKLKIKYLRLDGQTPQKDRSRIVDEFNSGMATVFLISLKAGGTGLNLTAADTVVHFDPWWNPSVEEQASARAHRIGQKKCVQVINLIAKGTIEDAISEVKEKKRELIDSLIQSGGTYLSELTVDEIKNLLRF